MKKTSLSEVYALLFNRYKNSCANKSTSKEDDTRKANIHAVQNTTRYWKLINGSK